MSSHDGIIINRDCVIKDDICLDIAVTEQLETCRDELKVG